jgi:hypothetical protein
MGDAEKHSRRNESKSTSACSSDVWRNKREHSRSVTSCDKPATFADVQRLKTSLLDVPFRSSRLEDRGYAGACEAFDPEPVPLVVSSARRTASCSERQ